MSDNNRYEGLTDLQRAWLITRDVERQIRGRELVPLDEIKKDNIVFMSDAEVNARLGCDCK